MSQLLNPTDTSREYADAYEDSLVRGAAADPEDARTVLIVDDDRQIRLLLRFTLEDLGYTVLEARDGQEGLDMLRARGREQLIVLVDYRMPRMDGWELLRVATEDAALGGRHAFVLITADAGMLPADFSDLLEEHAIPVLGKPFQLDDLDLVMRQRSRQISSRAVECAVAVAA